MMIQESFLSKTLILCPRNQFGLAKSDNSMEQRGVNKMERDSFSPQTCGE